MDAAVFLDKDGTLIDDVPYNVDPGRVRLSTNAVPGLLALQDAGYRLVVVSNQSGVARGYFEAHALRGVEHYLRGLLWSRGVALDGFYYCPHHPGGTVPGFSLRCDCRKPEPGMLLRAAADLGLDLQRSWMIGDILHDIEAGRRAGCRTVLLDNGNETEWQLTHLRTPHAVARDIAGAARSILAASAASFQLQREG